ncbi:hypothetical protein PILCRDRAFT_706 [Piloderma croceum F 1598]|uniref:Uncharacterized protein n=1 Tax=Piloderma croceum (strain F 1598) TaxID=765440 RepID=A0A0C3CP75_PILCF|nr:hypothetical protein PILCRDRAFT_698 [Piloderma croceum F 1598]KIM91545.1 hypothetical protein PILCRDRAFT_706 [Piloderma croceum F 1598]
MDLIDACMGTNGTAKKKSRRSKAVGQTKISRADGLGKVIYYEGTQEVIGTVSHIYNSPSVGLPYPQGYQHDLALITGPYLPGFLQPPNCAKLLTTFATPEEALSVGTVFLLMSDFCRSKPGTLDVVNGHVVPCVARDALIMGIQSSWDYTEHMETTNSLIWRSNPDDKSVQGASGTLPCLGSNVNETVKGLMFQNFQGGYHGQHWQAADKGHEEISGVDGMATFKGGFFLPNEVQVGTIILDDQEGTRRVFLGKGPEPTLHVHVEQKRNFTA